MTKTNKVIGISDKFNNFHRYHLKLYYHVVEYMAGENHILELESENIIRMSDVEVLKNCGYELVDIWCYNKQIKGWNPNHVVVAKFRNGFPIMTKKED